MRTDTSSSQGRPTAGLHWWRQVIDPAEEEFVRSTCPQGARTILPVCADYQRQVAWSSRYHIHACFTCDRWWQAHGTSRPSRAAPMTSGSGSPSPHATPSHASSLTWQQRRLRRRKAERWTPCGCARRW